MPYGRLVSPCLFLWHVVGSVGASMIRRHLRGGLARLGQRDFMEVGLGPSVAACTIHIIYIYLVGVVTRRPFLGFLNITMFFWWGGWFQRVQLGLGEIQPLLFWAIINIFWLFSISRVTWISILVRSLLNILMCYFLTNINLWWFKENVSLSSTLA